MRLFALGLIAGAALTVATVAVTVGWYEYRMVDYRDEAASLVRASGWEIVPGQPDERYLRRSRLHLH